MSKFHILAPQFPHPYDADFTPKISYVISNPLLAYRATDVTIKNKVRDARIVLNLLLIMIKKFIKNCKSNNYQILILLRDENTGKIPITYKQIGTTQFVTLAQKSA